MQGRVRLLAGSSYTINAAATSFTDSNRVARDWTSNQDKSHLCITPASSKLLSVIVDKKANEVERCRYRIFE